MSTKTGTFLLRAFSAFALLSLLFGPATVTPARAAGILYATSTGTGDCSSWANACTLQTALTAAASGEEIWVAAGAHKPTTGSDRTATFQLKDNVAIYGGFAGTETARDQRNFEAYVTILTGDLNGDDVGFTNNEENVYHVVTGATGATLDGFTVTAGNASGSNFGGGMYNNASSPILFNLIFNSNWADSYGGGMYNANGSNPILTNVTFDNNSATPFDSGRGGGMYNNASSPTLTNVTFSNNSADYCGGMYNNTSNPTLMNAIFDGNRAESWGAGMCNRFGSNSVLTSVTFNGNSARWAGGGLYNRDSNPTLTNVIFSNNSASEGGGMANSYSSPTLTNVTFSNNWTTTTTGGGGMYNASSNPTLTNVTFYGNRASSGEGGGIKNDQSSPVLENVTFTSNSGGGMDNRDSNPQIRNTIFWGNTDPNGAQIFNYNSMPIVSDSIVQGGYAGGTNIIIADPMLGTLGNYGGFTQTIPLLGGSSAIDTANDVICSAFDQRGIARPQGAHCDIGAFEFEYTGIFAKPVATGTGDCSTWPNACTLQTALATAVSGDEIWVTAGTHKPTTDSDREATFQLKDGVAVYGGFAGTETARDQRDFDANVTLLSGDLNSDDNSNVAYDEPSRADNSYHVVTGATGATLDGFTITGGNASGDSPYLIGGGIYNDGNSPALTNIKFNDNSAFVAGGGMYNGNGSNPVLTDVIFNGNSANDGGGMHNEFNSNPVLMRVAFSGNLALHGAGMRNDFSSPTLTNITFNGNSAVVVGGGMYNNSSDPILTNVVFTDNSANSGGGMFNDFSSSPTLTNITFSGNSAGLAGGGMYNNVSSPALINVTFSGNLADDKGGGMYNNSGASVLTNVTFSGNLADDTGGGMFNDGGSQQIRNTIFWGNTASNGGAQIYDNAGVPTVSDSVVQDGYATGTNIITADPMLGALGNHGGFTQVIPLLAGSSAIDTGNNSVCPDDDQRGIARPQGTRCDIGAFEVKYAGIYYTKSVTSGTGNCFSWANACTLQTALTTATSGDEIWVIAGTHKPTTGSDREATFQLKDGVAVYGGFAGTETARDQRDFETNLTILSGDLNGDDVGITNNSENSYHVVTGATGASLDGFTVRGGNADGISPNDRGGGMFNENSSPTLTNLTFDDNCADDSGGGMHNTSISNPTLMNVAFSGNYSNEDGGGMSNYYSYPTLMNVTFSANHGYQGGGVSNAYGSAPTFTNVTFSDNWASHGGGMFNHESSPGLLNVTFESNSAYHGGGMFNFFNYPSLTNVTFSNNSAAEWGGGMYNVANSHPTIRNTIFWGNTASSDGAQIYDNASAPSVSDSVVQGGYTGGTNIITVDPLLGALGDYGGFTQTIPLLPGSSAIDTGNDAVCPSSDQRGVARPQGDGCDIGAFEYIISPAAFEKLGPTEAEANVSLSPSISWQTSDGATSYEYCYSSAPGPCTKWNSVGANTAATLNGLAPNYTYYWQVRAVDAGGTTEADGGVWWSFTTTAAPACTWPSYTAPATPTFGDVPMTVGHWSWVERLANSTITAGCGNGNYCPFSEVVRAQMAIFLLRGKHCGSSYTPPAVGATTGFGDVPLDATYAPWVKQLAVEGVTAGCGGGNFCPQTVVNRAQMAIFLLRAKHGSTYSPPAVGADTGFGDVPLDVSYAPWVKQLATEGITAGCGNGNFCPLQNVNRAQMATFLVRAFGLP